MQIRIMLKSPYQNKKRIVKMETVLVTGAGGFIGSHLTEALMVLF